MDGSLWAAAVQGGRLEAIEIDPAFEEVRFGALYWAKVSRIDAGLDAAFVDLDGDNTGLLNIGDIRVRDKETGAWKKPSVSAGKALMPGQMILVQAKDSLLAHDEDQKSPRVSMDISLPGRYLIHTPMDGDDNRISRRIRDPKLRGQLEEMLAALAPIQGCILRSSAAHVQTDVLLREGSILKAMWEQIRPLAKGRKPGLLMSGLDAVQRMVADMADTRIERIEVVTLDRFRAVEEWCEIFAPDLVPRIRPLEIPNADQALSLFSHRDILDQIADATRPYALLDHGGSLIIQETAALTAVDVNRGADKRGALAINIEAANELARQLRIRNIGGILVIDFLRMKSAGDRDALLKALKHAFDIDPCTVQVHGYTPTGMIEATRQRRTATLDDRLALVMEDVADEE